jgi:ribonuclease III
LAGNELGTGTGRSKKEAEQHAAQMALEILKSHLQNDPSSQENQPRS